MKLKQYRNLMLSLKKVEDFILQIVFKATLMIWKAHGKYKEVISLKEWSNIAPSNFFGNSGRFFEPQKMANVFTKYFANVATDIFLKKIGIS